MKASHFLLILIVLLLKLDIIKANNIQITNVSLTNDSTINFNISWDNSWKVNVAPFNHDAAWVFVKKRDCASGQWSHVDLSSTLADHTAATPLEIYIDGKDPSLEAKGIFLRRTAVGTGNIPVTSISLRLKGLPVGEFDFNVFGIEMVNIPEESFHLGDGSGSASSYRDGATANPFYVTSEDTIYVGAASGQLSTSSSSYRPLQLPAAFPKGFKEIYSMKYEISHKQYVDYLNLLNSDQILPRIYTHTVSRSNVTGAWPNFTTTVPHRPKNFMSWVDFLAYLDWSALRPMTDLEFEKICRGPIYPIANEYAWGTSLVTITSTLVNDGTPTESCTTPIVPGSGLACSANVVKGPIRCGFAAGTATTRLEAGATYYGVLDMSGNLYEWAVSTRVAQGVAYTGILGDGEISKSPTAGFANVVNWPSTNGGTGSSSVPGATIKGGGWNGLSGRLEISDRFYASYPNGARHSTTGGRGVR